MEKKKIFTAPIHTLDLSENFKQQSESMGFEKLEDIISVPPEQLLLRKGFTFHWLADLSEFLDKHGLLYLLQAVPGKNHG